jgi:hypothetical protein
MTNMRTQRARYLGEQLTEAMTALAAGTQGSDAVLFLERLARLEGYPPEELAGPGDLRGLIAEARAARGEHAAELGEAAGRAVNVERFLEIGRNLPPADRAGERDSWLRDLLLLATITPWLGRGRQLVVKGALAKARAIVDAEPEAFLGAAVVAEDRRALEQPSALGPEAREILALLEDLPLLVVFDRTPEAQSEARVNAALRAAGADMVDQAEDALDNRNRRPFVRLPSTAGGERMAAAGEAAIVLLAVETGRWVFLQRGGLARLRFESVGDPEDVGVDLIEGGEPRALVPGSAGEFVLPTLPGELVVRLRVGPDSRVLTLEPSER